MHKGFRHKNIETIEALKKELSEEKKENLRIIKDRIQMKYYFEGELIGRDREIQRLDMEIEKLKRELEKIKGGKL